MEESFELLVSCMNAEPGKLVETMHIDSDAVVVNQTDHYDYEEKAYDGNTIRFISMEQKGVGCSRNNCLIEASADIVLFADEDIVYESGYKSIVLNAFKKNPKADMIMFNVNQSNGRETYHIEKRGRVRLYNCGRYSAYSMAVRLDSVRKANVFFSLLFGGGAKYSNGEDSLFISDCLKKGMKCYKEPQLIGTEKREGESTWFSGYNDKYFYDRGVLYRYLYGALAGVMGLRFLLKTKRNYEDDMFFRDAHRLLRKGIRQADEE